MIGQVINAPLGSAGHLCEHQIRTQSRHPETMLNPVLSPATPGIVNHVTLPMCEKIPLSAGYLWIELNNCVTKCDATYRKQCFFRIFYCWWIPRTSSWPLVMNGRYDRVLGSELWTTILKV